MSHRIQTKPHEPTPPLPLPISYTLRVGVTGHRDLKNPLVITGAVERTLGALRNTLEAAMADPHQPLSSMHSRERRIEAYLVWKLKRLLAAGGILRGQTPLEQHTELRFSIISALAKGADRLVVDVAMKKWGARLEVMLPFAADDYRRDFATQDDLGEFDALLQRADCVVEPRSTDPAGRTQTEESRDVGYKRVGMQIAQSCEILVTVWDGQPAQGHGGTAEVIEYALSLNRVVIWVNATAPEQPARLVTSIRTGPKSYSIVSEPLPRFGVMLSANYVQLAEYNRDAAFQKNEFLRSLSQNRSRLEKALEETRLEKSLIDPALNVLLPHYARANQLAIHYRRMHIRSAAWLYHLAAIAVAVAVFQTLLRPEERGWIFLEILALVGAVVLFRLSLCQNWHDKWLSYRHLAERLRTAVFTSLLGPEFRQQCAARDCPLPFYQGPGGWVSLASDTVTQTVAPRAVAVAAFEPIKKFLLLAWIEDQIKFHDNTARDKAAAAQHDQLFIGSLLAITGAAALGHLLKVVDDPLLEKLIAAAAIILPAFAAAQHAIAGIHDNERIASRSDGMKVILREVERKVNEATTETELRREIAHAEDLMSTENHEWCVSLSFRRLSMPV
jgi:hypothetical protein